MTVQKVTRALSLDTRSTIEIDYTRPFNLVRLDFDNGPVFMSSGPQVQLENLLKYSEQFNNGVWTTSNATITADQAEAPSGEGTADKVTVSATTSTHYVEYLDATLADDTLLSDWLYFKPGSGVARVALQPVAKNGSGPALEYRFEDGRVSATTLGAGQTEPVYHVERLSDGWVRLRVGNWDSLTGATVPRFRVHASCDPSISDAFWNKTGSSSVRSAGGTTPLPGWTFDSLIEDGGNTGHYVSTSVRMVQGRTYRFRIAAKELPAGAKRYLSMVLTSGDVFAASKALNLDVDAGTVTYDPAAGAVFKNVLVTAVGSSKVIEFDVVPEGTGVTSWQVRLWNVAGTFPGVYLGDASSGLYVGGAYAWDLDETHTDIGMFASLATTYMVGTGAEFFYVWGAQRTSGSGFAPYVPTEAALYAQELFFPGLVDVGQFSWGPDGDQNGQIELFNENNSAVALVLSNGVAEVPCTVYDCYIKADSSVTVPVITVSGVLTDSDITPTSAIVSVTTVRAAVELLPRRYVTPAEGFNWLPPDGAQLTWGSETYYFERD